MKRVYNYGEFPIATKDKTFTPEQKRQVLLDIYKAMASSGKTIPRGIVQQLTVLGMASPATTTHVYVKLSCWLTTTPLSLAGGSHHEKIKTHYADA